MKQVYKEISNKLTKFVFHASTAFEWIISLIILLAIGIEILDLIGTYQIFNTDFSTVELNEMLSDILGLVVGLEFIKMMMLHSHGAILEVLMFATARQLILDHSMQGHLLGVVAIAGLFAIWRFLYDRNEEKARLERILEHIRAKEETNQPLNMEEMDTIEVIEKAGVWKEYSQHHR
ncbi:MAG: hypothetical protein J6E42_02535 [Firmicutes bacterium]|nr:hypothetical protein [Bacillota bacterium]